MYYIMVLLSVVVLRVILFELCLNISLTTRLGKFRFPLLLNVFNRFVVILFQPKTKKRNFLPGKTDPKKLHYPSQIEFYTGVGLGLGRRRATT